LNRDEIDKTVAKSISDKMGGIFNRKPDFTGQINIEMHLRHGALKDVYISERAKVNVK
jgi:hypothetical protein